MEEYIAQLIEEIESRLVDNSHKAWDVFESPSESEIKLEAANETFLNGQKIPLQNILGINKESFPPAEKLTDDQITRLVDALELLFEQYNFELSYPDDELSDRSIYYLIREELTVDTTHLRYGRVGIEFCDYNIKNCPIPGQCKGCEKASHKVDFSNLAVDTRTIAEHAAKGIDKPYLKQKKQDLVQKVKDFVPKAENIPGIFDYCDRWCERCQYTNRCSNFELMQELNLGEEEDEELTVADELESLFKGTLEVIADKAQEFGIEIDEIENDLYAHDLATYVSHPEILEQALDYSAQITDWLENNRDYFSDVGSTLWNKFPVQYRVFIDILDTIAWYHTIIPAKIKRALTLEKKQPEFEYDNLGSAKVALISIDYSIDAFSDFHERLSKKEDEILSFLSTLTRLRADLEKAIPGGRNFIRPGFDDVEPSV